MIICFKKGYGAYNAFGLMLNSTQRDLRHYPRSGINQLSLYGECQEILFYASRAGACTPCTTTEYQQVTRALGCT